MALAINTAVKVVKVVKVVKARDKASVAAVAGTINSTICKILPRQKKPGHTGQVSFCLIVFSFVCC
jgi:ribosomal protein L14